MRCDFYEPTTCLDPLAQLLMAEDEDGADFEVEILMSQYQSGTCRTSTIELERFDAN